jgi:hypothetical protein
VLDYEIKDSSKNLWHYLADEDFGVHGLTVRGISSAMEVFGSQHMDSQIDSMIAFYRAEWVKIDHLAMEAIAGDYERDHNVQKLLTADERLNRIAVPQIMGKCVDIYEPKHFKKVLKFLVTEACLDMSEEVRISAK